MQNLKELIRIAENAGQLDVLESYVARKKDSNLYRLFSGIQKGKYRNDSDAQDDITTKHYSELKSELLEKLLKGICIIDFKVPAVSSYRSAQAYCDRMLLCTKIAFASGAHSTGITLTKKALNVAVKYQLTSIQIQLLRALQRDASLSSGKKFEDISAEIAKLKKVLDAEEWAVECFHRLQNWYISKKEGLNELANDSLIKVTLLQERHQTFTLSTYQHRIHAFVLQLQKKYFSLRGLCTSVVNYLEIRPQFDRQSYRAEFALIEMASCLHLRHYEAGESCAKRCIENFAAGSDNEAVFLGYYFLLCMHTENYAEATSIYLRGVKKLHPQHQQKWELFGAYLSLVRPDLVQFDFSNLKLPALERDKTGYSPMIIALSMLNWLKAEQVSRMIDKVEALKKFCTRYLKNDVGRRADAFLRLLCIVVESDFQRQEFEKRAASYLRVIDSTRYNHVADKHEIVPFGTLLHQFVFPKLRSQHVS